jgi:hypothetical protein
MGAATIGPDTKPGGTSGEMMGNGTEHAGKMLGKCWEIAGNGWKMVGKCWENAGNWMDVKENFESVLLFSIKVGE